MQFRVIHYYTSSEVFIVEADSAEHASEIVNGAGSPQPIDATGPSFDSEWIESAESDFPGDGMRR